MSRHYLPVDVDVLPLILSFLPDRHDLFNAALVNKAIYRAGIPYLYESLDSRLWNSPKVSITSYSTLRLPHKTFVWTGIH